MRAGGCTIQQALTADAATVVKQAVALARRRGHAQVTPLHVANTMLTSSTGLLRTACLQSHSHPLQCKALELCFNVALNRLPASTSTPILPSSHHSQHFPSISNALVAAFKRAQAHQRRGSVENQQQPLLAVKIELEQLIISILDDPSVSRVMREAGFSSTQVKSNVEQTVSLDICSPSNSLNGTKTKSKEIINISNSSSKVLLDPIRDEDVMCVIEDLMVKRRRSVVIIGECVVSMEGVVKGVMEKVEKGEVAEELREVKFITLPLASFGHLSRLAIEQKVEEVKNHVRRFMSKGVVLNLGDLKWVIEKNRATSGYSFCPMEHMIMELGKLGSNGGEGNNGRFWIMGIATFQTYMKCKSSHVWGNFHPITIPAGSLRLSLISTDHSDVQSDQSTINKVGNGSSSSSSWIILEGKDEMMNQQQQLTCCSECSTKFETEARTLKTNTTCNSDSSTSTLPAWLQKCKNENNGLTSNLDQDSVTINDLRKKWNSICSSIHQLPNYSNNCDQRTLTFSCVSPSSSTSGFSYSQHQHQHHHHDWPAVQPDQPYWIRNQNLTITTTSNIEPNLRIYINPGDQKQVLPLFSPNPNNSTPNSTSSSDIMDVEYPHKFKEVNAENLMNLCNALEKKVPWQKDIIPEIASTVLQCRAGMVRRKGHINVRNVDEVKNETWLFFQGIDMEAKEKIAKELGRLVFGSSNNNFISISLSSFSSTRADSTDQDCRNKRSRDEQSCSYIERFSDAVSSNPHRVFLVEDVEQADYCSQIGFKRAMEVGRVSNSCGEEVGLSDAIIILSCESFSSRSRACSPPIKQKMLLDDQSLLMVEEEEKEMMSPNFVSLDLNISIDDGGGIGDDESIDDIGLLESVDRRIIFKIQELTWGGIHHHHQVV